MKNLVYEGISFKDKNIALKFNYNPKWRRVFIFLIVVINLKHLRCYKIEMTDKFK